MLRHMARMARYAAWVTPEAIKERRELFEAEAAAALAHAKTFARDLEVLPVPDPLPKEMQGQSASTIQAMLRHLRDG